MKFRKKKLMEFFLNKKFLLIILLVFINSILGINALEENIYLVRPQINNLDTSKYFSS